MLSDRAPVELEPVLPASEAALLIMLLTSRARLQKHRAETPEWTLYRAA